jgi:hypothetical protein
MRNGLAHRLHRSLDGAQVGLDAQRARTHGSEFVRRGVHPRAGMQIDRRDLDLFDCRTGPCRQRPADAAPDATRRSCHQCSHASPLIV